MIFQKAIPPACFPIDTELTNLERLISITSTTPGSPPTPSTETNAYLLSGEITTPCVTLELLEINEGRFFESYQTSVFASPLSVATKNFPSEDISILYGPFPVLIRFVIDHVSISTSIISSDPLPAT